MASRVPRTTEVLPGAGVSIVLKADQPTGREVQGVVKDVLTNGNHPRGIKVRLADGRIGRVQRMVGQVGGGGVSAGTTQQTAVVDDSATTSAQGQRPFAQRARYRDVRLDEELEAPAEQVGLDAYLVAPKRKGKGQKGAAKSSAPSHEGDDDDAPTEDVRAPEEEVLEAQTVTCPVCGDIKGDEAAVAHHVSSHFD